MASFSVLSKHKFLSFVNFCLFLHDFSIFWLERLYIAPIFRDQPRGCTDFGAKLAFIAGIFLKKYPWCMKIHFQFYFFAIWRISTSVLSIIEWKALASDWFPSELVMFLKIDLRCFGPFGKFQDTKEIFMTARVSRLFFCFLWLCLRT